MVERKFLETLVEEVSKQFVNQFVNYCQHCKWTDAQMDAIIRDVIVNRA